MERRRRLGIVAPNSIPLPDDIIIDMQTGTARIEGPITKEQKAARDELCRHKVVCNRKLAKLRSKLESESDERIRGIILRDIKQQTKMLAMISEVIVD